MTERPLDDCGFVRVPSDGDPLWMTCDSCKKSDHFWLEEAAVCCRCGARYTHAVRPDGQKIPAAELTFTPFKEGPVQLADLELDKGRLALVVGVIVAIGGAIAWALLGS